jgi:hypothetical protein
MPPSSAQWTDDDVDRLIETLKAERPDFWAVYVEAEIKLEVLNDDVMQWIITTGHRPNAKSGSRSDGLSRE